MLWPIFFKFGGYKEHIKTHLQFNVYRYWRRKGELWCDFYKFDFWECLQDKQSLQNWSKDGVNIVVHLLCFERNWDNGHGVMRKVSNVSNQDS